MRRKARHQVRFRIQYSRLGRVRRHRCAPRASYAPANQPSNYPNFGSPPQELRSELARVPVPRGTTLPKPRADAGLRSNTFSVPIGSGDAELLARWLAYVGECLFQDLVATGNDPSNRARGRNCGLHTDQVKTRTIVLRDAQTGEYRVTPTRPGNLCDIAICTGCWATDNLNKV